MLEILLLTNSGQETLARYVREIPGRLEKQLSLRSTELSNEALEAVLVRLAAFREEIGKALENLPQEAKKAAEIHHRELSHKLTDLEKRSGETTRQLAQKLDESLRLLENQAREAMASKSAETVEAVEERFRQTERLFAQNLEALAANYEKQRLEMAKEYEQQSNSRGAGILANTYRGNWEAGTLYLRGETFSFRGGWHLVLADSRGQMPGNATLKGPGKVYALLAAPGAPGVSTTTTPTLSDLRLLFIQARPGFTALTGGGATSLDGEATAGGAQPTGATILTTVNAFPQVWKLTSGTDAEDGLTVIRPDDYNASTNARIWKLQA